MSSVPFIYLMSQLLSVWPEGVWIMGAEKEEGIGGRYGEGGKKM